MEWTKKNVLLQYSEYTPCKDIFQAVCDEIGEHYIRKGYKYSRTRPKITIIQDKIKLDICFWSSRSNILGNWVHLEILPNFYSNQLEKESKIKGFLFGQTALFYHKQKGNNNTKVIGIYGDVIERQDDNREESIFIDSNNCNIYAIDEAKFYKIISFIDYKIIPWLSKIQTDEGIIDFLKDMPNSKKRSLMGKTTNSNFIDYVKLNFPYIKIDEYFTST